jgi:hypothetical protein
MKLVWQFIELSFRRANYGKLIIYRKDGHQQVK